MAKNQILTVTVEPVDVVTVYGYPATAYVIIAQSDVGSVHQIWYGAAPAALFNNAPNGSILINVAAGAVHYYIKDKAIGTGIDGTWRTLA
jgi:hypothetical protein